MLNFKNLFKKRDSLAFHKKVYCDHHQVVVAKPLKVSIDANTCLLHFEALFADELYDYIREFAFYPEKKDYNSISMMWSANFVLAFNGKPLRRTKVLLKDYGIRDGDTIRFVHYGCLLGGASPPINDKESYNVTLERYMLRYGDVSYHVQSEDSERMNDRVMGRLLHQYFSRVKLPDQEWFMGMVENVVQLQYWFKKCHTVDDFWKLAFLSYKLFTGKPLSAAITRVMQRMLSSEIQSDDEMTKTIKKIRNLFDMGLSVGENPMVKKVNNLFSYLLVQGFLTKFGMTMSDEEYSKAEQRAMLSAYSSKKNFLVCIVDTALFIIERLNNWRITGKFSSFLYSTDACSEWLDTADRLLNLAPFTGNLQAHGTTYFSFIADLREAIEKGESFSKFVSEATSVSPAIIGGKLKSLKLLQNTEITRRAAAQERKAPFGVLVYGGSSVAKSCFSKMLFNYFGALNGLENGDEFRYIRNSMDEYWSNFDTSKWCIQLDDIAFRNPNKCPDVDPTLVDMLNVVNNVPYVPPQAALEDKGKTPVLANLVIATTNCANLNAQEYFWCPLAVMRRLPYVVKVEPKAEFLHSNGRFIDPTKIYIDEDSYPDLWDIYLYKVEGERERGRDFAKHVFVKKFTDVNEFLKDFGRASRDHAANQEKAMSSDNKMRKITVCETCFAPKAHCDCVFDVQSSDNFYDCIGYLLTVEWIWRFVLYVLTYSCVQKRLSRYLLTHIKDRKALQVVDAIVDAKSDKRLLLAITGFSMLAAVVVGVSLCCGKKSEKTVSSMVEARTEETEKEVLYTDHTKDELEIHFTDKSVVVVPMKEVLALQGNIMGTTEKDLEKEETANVWYDNRKELAAFDLPIPSQSLVGVGPEKIRDMFGNNCVYLRIDNVGKSSHKIMRGIYVVGQYLMTNDHAFRKDCDTFKVTILRSKSRVGVTEDFSVSIKSNEIIRHPTKDLCMVKILSGPPEKDIRKFWAIKTVPVFEGLELIRLETGHLLLNAVHGINHHENVLVEPLENAMDFYIGHSTFETQNGLCGSPLFGITPKGITICGLHTMGREHSAGFQCIVREDIDYLLKDEEWIIQGGGAPKLCAEAATKVLSPVLHHKSVFRYIEQGSANLYGSLEGFRPRPKSKVCATPLQDFFLNLYGRKVEHGAPKMGGWQPWRRNVEEMVKMQSNIDREILQDCAEAFLDDITLRLPKGWEGQLVFLSKEASLLGLPDVKYIDGVNRGSSMGFPWCKPKSNFLTEKKSEMYPDGVDLPADVWDRFDAIVDLYRQGIRAFVVFNGQLKDEALPLLKCLIGKTRMFTAAPVDWSLVVRSRLLTFVRLVQKNKGVFEAAPGLVTQSNEWSWLHDHLSIFGTDQIVAGDYKAYDKTMLADVILTAFWIIAKVYYRAGFSEAECLEIMAIGYDVAFSVCNINGDLVMFFGTNPSGHPLTVIINSLVNSLYIRYAYAKLGGDVRKFKEHVRLMTYGDDNIMGISREVPWFNHCSIQRVLAEINITYTMADKEAESVPYISIYDTQFLKRRWRYDEDMECYLAELDEDSIFKSLTVWTPSGSDPVSKHMVMTISTANSEYFFFGKKKFNEMHAVFKKVIAAEPYCYYVNESTLPNWDQLAERFKRSSDLLAKSQN